MVSLNDFNPPVLSQFLKESLDEQQEEKIKDLEAKILSCQFILRDIRLHAVEIMDDCIRKGHPFKKQLELIEHIDSLTKDMI